MTSVQIRVDSGSLGDVTIEQDDGLFSVAGDWERSRINDLLDSAAAAVRRTYQIDRPEVVVLCGSTRFYDEFQRMNFALTLENKIVLSVGFYANSPEKMVQQHGEGVGITPQEKLALDNLHKRKIDLADRVFVLNVGGCIGKSTRSEINYALAHGKPVEYLEPVGA